MILKEISKWWSWIEGKGKFNGIDINSTFLSSREIYYFHSEGILEIEFSEEKKEYFLIQATSNSDKWKVYQLTNHLEIITYKKKYIKEKEVL